MHHIPDGGMFYKKISSEYRIIAKKGKGTFSEVLKAQCLKTSKLVAIKCMKNTFDSLEQVTNLREIQALQRLAPHANIIKLLDVIYDEPTGKLALVFELMDMNIYEMIRGRRTYLSEERIKSYMYQLIKAVDHMHQNGIFHRDIKPENILIIDEVLKLADFGSCRGIYSKQPYTEYISTRWYRSPECLLTDGYYNYKMDMWGVGCVFFEIISLFPLFPGNNELDQIQKIHKVLGTPPPQLLEKLKRRSQHADFSFPQQDGSGIARLIPHASPSCLELLSKLLAYNPDERWSARQALRHIYFKELRDRDKFQQAFLNAASRSLRPSPSVGNAWHLSFMQQLHYFWRTSQMLSIYSVLAMQDVAGCKSRASEVLKMPFADQTRGGHGNPSASYSSQSLLVGGVPQFPLLSNCIQLKEAEKGTARSTPALNFGNILSPMPSHGSALSMYAGPIPNANCCRDLHEGNIDASRSLPPVKGSCQRSVSPPKVTLSHACCFQRSPMPMNTPKFHSTKCSKVIKGVKNQRLSIPDLSPKWSIGVYKPGEPPPYKKRVNNKYISPYSQKYFSQSPSFS